MEHWMYNEEIRKEVLEPFHRIADQLEAINKTLFDTLGSADAGDALKAVDRIADALDDWRLTNDE